MATRAKHYFTPEQYLRMERQAPDGSPRHEYLAGEVFAMSGASFAHNRITANIVHALATALTGRDCDVLSSDMRVHIEATAMYTYPDVVVVCGEPVFTDEGTPDTLTNPVALFEVLSSSTRSYLPGRKVLALPTPPTLRDYVLVSQDAAHADISNTWYARTMPPSPSMSRQERQTPV